MLVQELINLINLEADELLDTDADVIPYINSAIDYLSNTLCGMKDPEMMVLINITSGDLVPSNLAGLVPANGYPIRIVGDKFYTTVGATVNDVKYATHKNHITLVSDVLPFKEAYASVLTFIASYLIKKKTYIPVEYTNTDKSFVGDVINAIKAAKGVV